MQLSQLILPLLMQAFGGQKPPQNQALAKEVTDALTAALRKELYRVSAKILAASTLTAALIYSLIVLLGNARSYIDLYVDGRVINNIVFGTLALACLGVIGWILKSTPASLVEEKSKPAPLPNVNEMVTGFTQGFLRGFKKENRYAIQHSSSTLNPESRSAADREQSASTQLLAAPDSRETWNESLRDRRDFA